jgi:DNA polymerase III epsilon subunit-like protein
VHVFLDFEASSLHEDSYPIEVGWVAEDGACESHLIRPAPFWTADWDPAAEALHGLSRERLLAEGEPYDDVARRTLEALGPHEVLVSAPSWDGKWMSVLLRAAGLPRHALRLKDADEAHTRCALDILGAHVTQAEAPVVAAALLQAARRGLDAPPRHRALADARAELAVWREIRRLARREAAARAAG